MKSRYMFFNLKHDYKLTKALSGWFYLKKESQLLKNIMTRDIPKH